MQDLCPTPSLHASAKGSRLPRICRSPLALHRPQRRRLKMDPGDVKALLQESSEVRESAGRLIRDFRVVEQWEPFGAVELAGGYRWDLMLAPDVDLYVVNPEADLDLALRAFSHFARQGDFLAFGF